MPRGRTHKKRSGDTCNKPNCTYTGWRINGINSKGVSVTISINSKKDHKNF